MVIRQFLLLLIGCNTFCFAFAQKTQRVQSEYIYYAPENVTLEKAKRIALERAQIQALADAFGTIVMQNNSILIRNENGNSSSDFFSLGASEVKGEWIETIDEPEYTISYEQGMLVVKVRVSGQARELVSAPIDFEARILCNGTDLRHERSDFRDGDDLYLYFQSPVNGYLAVYLLDETMQMVYCLLPYKNSEEVSIPVRRDKPYVFFSEVMAKEEDCSIVDEYTLTCSRDMELNDLYVIFSPNQFVKANSQNSEELLPRQLDYEDFQRWLAKARGRDKKMQLSKHVISITK